MRFSIESHPAMFCRLVRALLIYKFALNNESLLSSSVEDSCAVIMMESSTFCAGDSWHSSCATTWNEKLVFSVNFAATALFRASHFFFVIHLSLLVCVYHQPCRTQVIATAVIIRIAATGHFANLQMFSKLMNPPFPLKRDFLCWIVKSTTIYNYTPFCPKSQPRSNCLAWARIWWGKYCKNCGFIRVALWWNNR